MVPPPTRRIACRLTVTYAGFEGESTLLQDLYRRGLQQQQVAPSLYAEEGILMAWHHEPVASWQTEAWLAEMRRSLRPNQCLRMIENRFVTSESSFVTMAAWDRCVDVRIAALPPSRETRLFVGIDASVSTIAVRLSVSHATTHQVARLAFHRIFQPSSDEPLDFDQTISELTK